MFDVSVIGPLNIDLIMSGDGPPSWDTIPTWDGPAAMEMTAAGSIGYTVQNLARLGLSTCVSSCLSHDPLGGFVVDTLRAAGIDMSHVHLIPNTQIAIGAYMLLFGSRKRPLAYRLPTHDQWPLVFAPDERARLLDARVLHCGGYLHFREAWHGALVDLYREARARGGITTLDPQFPLIRLAPPWLPALDDLLPHVDVLLCDEHEACGITGQERLEDCALRLREAGARTVIIKRGEHGALIFTPDGVMLTQPAITVGTFVDSIGAGDAFDAGYIYGLLQGWDARICARFAAIAAGFSVTGVGGAHVMPGAERLLVEMRDVTL
jgi:sugar/nucleoside kinase (ribokinase family)